MKERLFAISFLVNLFFVVCGCGSVEKEEVVVPEVDIIEKNYQQNNSLALQRVNAIMYSQSEFRSTEELFKLVHISDPHLSGFSTDNHYLKPINLIQSVRFANQPQSRINAIAVTGDLIGNSWIKHDALRYLDAFTTHFYTNNHIPSAICIGNHDNNYYVGKEVNPQEVFITRTELNQHLFSADPNRKKEERSENYYYLDVPSPQGGYIRLISLDMIDHIGNQYDALHDVYYSQAQIEWLGNIALKKDITPQHSVVVLNHFPFEPTSGGGKSSYLCDGYFVHTWQMVPEIIEAYRSKTTISKQYPNRYIKGDSIYVDFDFTDNSGEFICHLGGHSHCFACFDLKDISNANPALPTQKMILCTNQAPTDAGEVYNRTSRKNATVSSNCFNIYAFDTEEKVVYVTFFGANAQLGDATYPEIYSFSYLDL
ncbi:putative MPP superfamily phosphohydrolase [Parabacteroides sp. PFB2-12]|uniref:metallophosphoesterase family protein n=1 Tax=unclassified Parabacteroides TaxID=2649774 RepID=UPI0024735F83|nr:MULTISPECIES: metallophosphoesterase [unclassified Parabacteroides]MDH6343468.1 putative MPP superfamily phosphohydrolase [Parabacteroides sp. PM6-13]MDH6390932.1 putative MPP superfamily phosphohydrolase [Parabacteroides sp. PFB2-12]